MTYFRAAPPEPVDDIDGAVEVLRSHGLRCSAARRIVLEALFAAPAPVSAETIARGLGGRVPPSDPGSVYRNLETLERVGLVRHFHVGHGAGLYALTGRAPEDHLVCERCGAVRAVDAGALEGIREELRRRFDWEAHFDHFPIAGLCGDCRSREERE